MEDLNEKHLAIFLIQGLVFALFIYVMGRFFLSFLMPDYKTEIGSIPKLISYVSNSETPEEKTELLSLFFAAPADYQKTVTAKTFVDNKIWLNARQENVLAAFIGIYAMAGTLSSIVFLLAGVGPFYACVRHIMASGMALGVPFIPLGGAGLAIIALVFGLAGAVSGVVTLVTLPIALIVHLVMGIIQTVGWIKDRVAA